MVIGGIIYAMERKKTHLFQLRERYAYNDLYGEKAKFIL